MHLDHALVLPITTMARQAAEDFSAQQITSDKAQQVRLNTLAVWVAHDYLSLMGIPSKKESSDSWNPVVRACSNVADLEVATSGRLECRAIQPNEAACYFPPEVWSDRIGYLVIQISENLRQASLLGFTPTVATERLSLTKLKPLESLLAHLSEFSLAQPPLVEECLTQLELWFSGLCADGWQAVDALLGEAKPAFSFRRAEIMDAPTLEGQVQRAKLISLLPEQGPVVLVMNCKPEAEQRLFCVQVHPFDSDVHVPANLRLTVLDEVSQPLCEVKSRQRDEFIQRHFTGHPGERFSIKIELGDAAVVENFVI